MVEITDFADGFANKHLFPNAIISEQSSAEANARSLLSSIGFNVEWRGNFACSGDGCKFVSTCWTGV